MQAGGIGLSAGPGRIVLEGPVGGGSVTTQLAVHVTAHVRIVFRTTSAVAQLQAAPAEESLVLFITPWKEIAAGLCIALAAVVLLILLRASVRRVRSRRRRSNDSTHRPYVAVSAISERTEPVPTRRRSAAPTPVPPVPDGPRRRIDAPPPKSGTPTV
jgi:hypothetical protein